MKSVNFNNLNRQGDIRVDVVSEVYNLMISHANACESTCTNFQRKRILCLLDLEEVAIVRTSKARVEMEGGVVSRPSFGWE
ncbi:MAG: hypothetical protein Q9171_002691 [Xanthocarpia ochracea]